MTTANSADESRHHSVAETAGRTVAQMVRGNEEFNFWSMFFANDAVCWTAIRDDNTPPTLHVNVDCANPKYVVRCRNPDAPPPSMPPGTHRVPVRTDPAFLATFETDAYRRLRGEHADVLRDVQRYTAEHARFARRRFWVCPTLKDGVFRVEFAITEPLEAPCRTPLGTIDGDYAAAPVERRPVAACPTGPLPLASVETQIYLHPHLSGARTFTSAAEAERFAERFR